MITNSRPVASSSSTMYLPVRPQPATTRWFLRDEIFLSIRALRIVLPSTPSTSSAVTLDWKKAIVPTPAMIIKPVTRRIPYLCSI